MPTRKVRGRIRTIGNRLLRFNLLTSQPSTPSYPVMVQTTTTEVGDFETDVAQAATYKVQEPDGDEYIIAVPFGSSTEDIEVLKNNATLQGAIQQLYDHIQARNPHGLTLSDLGGASTTDITNKVDKVLPPSNRVQLNAGAKVNPSTSGVSITIGTMLLGALNLALGELANRNEAIRVAHNQLVTEYDKLRQIVIERELAKS